ncbi:tetratricopeptide repeat-containing sensor histidine kinase [Sphingomonas sp. Leaf343]|uniref:tetratricopeptide repeat-containing sensor histidine kinase n=1 Tax=Sphingomonas sp. Leaf343 TaxID=1736345 RepID=UPI000B20EC16|nr:ATP-binding protein [Sphingomonas sp. Leaf343]
MRARSLLAAVLLAVTSMMAWPVAASPVPVLPAAKAAAAGVERAKAAMLSDVSSARTIARLAAAQARSVQSDPTARVTLATALWLQSEASLRLGDEADADRFLAGAYAIIARSRPESQLMGDILLTRGGVHGTKNEPAGALKDYQDAYRIFRALDNDRSQAIALLLIASLYSDAKDSDGAQRYLKQALDTYSGDPGLMIALHNGRGAALQELQRFDEAYQQLRLALNDAAELKSASMRIRILVNLVRNRLKAGKVAEADRLIVEAMTVSASGDAASWRPQVLAVAAQAALQRGDLSRAANLIDRSFAGVDLRTTTLSLREPHETAYTVYRRMGRTDLALPHLAAMKRIDDDATRLATTTSTALMAAQFDFTNQELRIATLRGQELQRRIELEQTRASTQRTIFYGGAGAAAIIVGLLVFALVSIRRSRDDVRAANAELGESNAALSRALAAKTEFLATTSHEIRTPLNGILGMTDVMLSDPGLAPLMRDRLGVVRGASVTMRALVDDILDVAKMETGNLTIEDATFDLAATLADSSRLWEEQARAKGVRFVAQLDACPRWVIGDAARVRQVVFNLLSNALKFTERGDVTLTAKTADDTVQIAIADTGIGIPADQLGQIFESFRQADASTTRRYGGTGLGLTICRKLARAMDGDVTVSSVPGEGATFTVTLPLRTAPAPMIGVRPADVPDLLIVERNPIARAMWTSLFARHAGRIGFAASADEAVGLLANGPVARVLIDDATVAANASDIARIATAAGAGETTLLWKNAHDVSSVTERTGVTRVVMRPVAGATLIDRLFVAQTVASGTDRLVSEPA